jgi:hypothetical protein
VQYRQAVYLLDERLIEARLWTKSAEFLRPEAKKYEIARYSDRVLTKVSR